MFCRFVYKGFGILICFMQDLLYVDIWFWCI